MNQRVSSIAPYAAQLLYDEDVRSAAKDAVGAASKVYARTRGRSAKRKASDKKLWRQLADALRAVFELLVALSTPPPPPKRRWPRMLPLAALIGGGAVLAAKPEARAALLRAVGKSEAPVPEAR